jgi:hypothetical protein
MNSLMRFPDYRFHLVKKNAGLSVNLIQVKIKTIYPLRKLTTATSKVNK